MFLKCEMPYAFGEIASKSKVKEGYYTRGFQIDRHYNWVVALLADSSDGS